jgi:hypothetical protein
MPSATSAQAGAGRAVKVKEMENTEGGQEHDYDGKSGVQIARARSRRKKEDMALMNQSC